MFIIVFSQGWESCNMCFIHTLTWIPLYTSRWGGGGCIVSHIFGGRIGDEVEKFGNKAWHNLNFSHFYFPTFDLQYEILLQYKLICSKYSLYFKSYFKWLVLLIIPIITTFAEQIFCRTVTTALGPLELIRHNYMLILLTDVKRYCAYGFPGIISAQLSNPSSVWFLFIIHVEPCTTMKFIWGVNTDDTYMYITLLQQPFIIHQGDLISSVYSLHTPFFRTSKNDQI